MVEKQFISDLEHFNVELSTKQLQQYQKYLRMLQEWNEKINLTAICDEAGVYKMHFYDSLLPFIRLNINQGSLCDVGAGAGFPSIPLKIAFPQLAITIVEPLNKRCIFLRELVKELELENVNICNERAEDFALLHRESFDYVSARAVANLNILAELCIPLVKEKGLFIALKGSAGEAEKQKASQAIKTLGASFSQLFIEEVGEHTHINLIYTKERATPLKYPRPYAKIKKSPL